MIMPNDVKLILVTHHILLFLSSKCLNELMQTNLIFTISWFLKYLEGQIALYIISLIIAMLYAFNKD